MSFGSRLFIIAIVISGFCSCNKANFQCGCVFEKNQVEMDTTNNLGEMPLRQAEKECDSFQEDLSSEAQNVQCVVGSLGD